MKGRIKIANFAMKALEFLVVRLPEAVIYLAIVIIMYKLFYLFIIRKEPVLGSAMQIISYGLIFSATVALLGFTYAISVRDRKVQSAKYEDLLYFSERLFHAVILLTRALIFLWFINHLESSSLATFKWFRYIEYFLYVLVFFVFGELLKSAKYLHCGLRQFNKVLESRIGAREED